MNCWLLRFDRGTDDPSDDIYCSFCHQDDVEDCIGAFHDAFVARDYPYPTTAGIGEHSVKLVRGESGSLGYVMLSNHLLEQYEEQNEILAAIENGICDSPFCDNPADCF
ncbi:MAG: hypothetical protein R6V85_21380, partial [Polyangia bacterium]